MTKSMRTCYVLYLVPKIMGREGKTKKLDSHTVQKSRKDNALLLSRKFLKNFQSMKHHYPTRVIQGHKVKVNVSS